MLKGKEMGAVCIEQETFEQGIVGGQAIGQVDRVFQEKSQGRCVPYVFEEQLGDLRN